jgi:hypothetical protein
MWWQILYADGPRGVVEMTARPIPQLGDDMCLSTGTPIFGKMVARGFPRADAACGWQISLALDGRVIVGACSATWPDVIANCQLFGRIGDPMQGLADAHIHHKAVRDRATAGGCFDLPQVTQDLMAVWAMISGEKEGG